MPSEVVCTHLSMMAHALEQAARIIFRKENEVCVCERESEGHVWLSWQHVMSVSFV